MAKRTNKKELTQRIAQLTIENELLRHETDVLSMNLIRIKKKDEKIERNVLNKEVAQDVVIITAMAAALNLFGMVRESIDDAIVEIKAFTKEEDDVIFQRLIKGTAEDWENLLKLVKACADILS